LVAVKTSRLLPSFHYPLVVALSFGQFALLRWLGLSLGVSTYTSIVTAALAVALLEHLYPSRAEWRPGGDCPLAPPAVPG
jgi:hypothetical protein